MKRENFERAGISRGDLILIIQCPGRGPYGKHPVLKTGIFVDRGDSHFSMFSGRRESPLRLGGQETFPIYYSDVTYVEKIRSSEELERAFTKTIETEADGSS